MHQDFDSVFNEHITYSKNRSFLLIDYTSNRKIIIKPYFHNSIELIYVAQGKVAITTAGFSYDLGVDDMIYFDHTVTHSLNLEENTRLIILKISMIWLSKVIPEFLKRPVFLCSFHERNKEEEEQYQHFVRLFQQLIAIFASTDDYKEIGVNGTVFSLLYELNHRFSIKQSIVTNTKYSYQKRIEEITNYINYNYDEEISLDILSQKFGITPQYVSKIFKKYLKINFKEYINQVRLEHAIYEMENSSDTLLNIAQNCGFSNQHSFIYIFKKHYLVTPQEYRRIMSRSTKKIL